MLIPSTEDGSENKNKNIDKTNSIGDINEVLQDTVFCGIQREELTQNQEKLCNKLDNEQRKKLARVAKHNKKTGEWEFQKIGIAMKDKDIVQNVTKQGADDAIKGLGNKWQLTKNSDFDKMIMDMPGATPAEQGENFILLTGVSGRYWTAENYHGSSIRFVVRIFNGKNSSSARGDDTDSDTHVRAVRSL